MFQKQADYRRLYPEWRPKSAAYCAPMIEDGVELEGVRTLIAAHTQHIGLILKDYFQRQQYNRVKRSGISRSCRGATGWHSPAYPILPIVCPVFQS